MDSVCRAWNRKATVQLRPKSTRQGVFPLLCGQRNAKVPVGGAWGVADLIGCLPDSRFELQQYLNIERFTGFSFDSYVCWDDREAWTLLDCHDSPAVTGSSKAVRLLRQHGFALRRDPEPYSNHRHDFVLESTDRSRISVPDWKGHKADLTAIMAYQIKPLYPLLGVDTFRKAEVSLLQHEGIPLAPPLARYAALFLLCSLVRYRPGLLQDPTARWLAQVFLEDSITPMLQSSCFRMTGQRLKFNPV